MICGDKLNKTTWPGLNISELIYEKFTKNRQLLAPVLAPRCQIRAAFHRFV